MASITVDQPVPPDRLSIESIPSVDLRLLSQSELAALSLCSSHAFDLRRCDDVVIPKIDRSVFNESAGSRKQTYSRLRLAPRKPDLSTPATTVRPRNPAPEPLDSEKADNSRIIALFKHLFNSNSSAPDLPPSDVLVSVNVEYSDALPAAPSDLAVSIPVFDGGERKRKRGRKPKGETLAPVPLAMVVVEEEKVASVSVPVFVEEEKAKEDREKELVNKNGVEVNLVELAKMEDPYGAEIKQRTEGRGQPEELLGFMSDLEGQWGSRRKKRKIVDANEFGDALPNGWKVLIAMKKKQGDAWLFCRRYVSPSGRYFVSCKDVSYYLLSLNSPQDLKQKMPVQCSEDSMLDDKSASENVVDIGTNTPGPLVRVASQSNGFENQLTQPCSSETIDHQNELISPKNVQPKELQVASALKCHKCSTPFNEKDGLLNHLVSCHKRKRRKARAPIEDDVMMKDGKYECQFCNKLFVERNSYFGHVGIHVKIYVKNFGVSPGVAVKQKTCDPVMAGGFLPPVSDSLGSVANANSVAGTPNNIQAICEPNLFSVDCKLKVGSATETCLDNFNTNQGNLVVSPEMNIDAAEDDKASSGESSGKHEVIVHTTDTKVGEVDEPAAVQADFCSGSANLLSGNENNVLCENSSQIDASECVASGITCPPPVLIENAKSSLLPDGNQVDLGNKVNSGSVGDINYEGIASINGTDYEEKSSSDQLSEDRSLATNTVYDSCYGDGMKDGDNDELMVGSDNIHPDLDVDLEDDDQHMGSMKEYSVVSDKEEETCRITDNKTDFMDPTLAALKVQRSSEAGICNLSEDQQGFGTQNYMGLVFTNMINETELDLCSLGTAEVEVDANCSAAQGRHIEDAGLSDVGNDSEKVNAVLALEPEGTHGFQLERTCNLGNSSGEISNKIGEEPRSDIVANSGNVFFASRSTDTPLDAKLRNNDQGKMSSACSLIPSGNNKARSDISNVFGAYNSFVEKKQEQDPKSFLSELSSNDQMLEIAINNVATVSAGTTSMKLPELDKVERQTNKMILDFGGMTEINGRFLAAGQHETVPESSSPFSVWGEPTCVEDNQTSAYDSSRVVNRQVRDSGSTSLNFVGLQQPCDGGYNLNKVCMNEQRFGVQHNETGIYSRCNETGREGLSHGNTLNLAGLRQQCDAVYNLNKGCQQNFGVQHSEPATYSDEARRERVTYGNSLSLASVRQTCDASYSLNKTCVRQDAGHSLNKGYIAPLQGLSKLEGAHMDLMIGFGNSNSKPNQGVETELLWRATEGNILPGSLVDSSSSQAQSSGFFQAFDFLSDKSGNSLCTGNEKFDSMSSFEGLRSTSVEPMEFSFLTGQDSNAHLEDPKVLSYNTEMDQGFGSSVWHQKGNSLPSMMGGHVMSTLCVWCGNEFHQDSLGCEMQAGSIGYLCPSCKARMSGQFL